MLIPKDLLQQLDFAVTENNPELIKTAKHNIKNYLLDNHSINSIIYDYMNTALQCKDDVRVEVSSDEMAIIQNAITNIFRVKGYKADGTIETRGRKKKNTELP